MLIKLNILLFFILLSIIHSTPLPEKCYNQLVQNQDCNWYTDCLQQKFQCGKTGYPVGFGLKYCQRFRSLKTFPKVRQWVKRCKECLKQKLLPLLKQEVTINCKKVSQFAYETHATCYEKSGFCQLFWKLSLKDSLVFARQLFGIYDFKDFLSYRAAMQVEQMTIKCFKQLFWRMKKVITKKLLK